MVRLGIGLYGVSMILQNKILKMWVLEICYFPSRTISAGERWLWSKIYGRETYKLQQSLLVMQTGFLEAGEWRWICNYKR
jgi:hypothetical protein